jgi:hypothetical protein
MAELALLAATLAALAVTAVAIRAYLAMGRLHRLVEQVGKVEAELAQTIEAWGQTARGVQQAVGNLDDGLKSLAKTLERVDRLTERLEPESVARTVVAPMVAKMAAWVSGLRKGLASARGGKGQEKVQPELSDGEEG